MKTIKQLVRQPLKTLLGVILMTLAVAVLCVCIGQALAAQTTKKTLDERFSTVAIPSLQEDIGGIDRYLVEDELLEWLEEIASEHPEIVKTVAPNRFMSAFIPEMLPYNTMQADNVKSFGLGAFTKATYAGETYFDSAMFVITLEEVSKPTGPVGSQEEEGEELLSRDNFATLNDYYKYLEYIYSQSKGEVDRYRDKTFTDGYTVTLKGTITEVLSLAETYDNPLGRTAKLTLTLPTLEEIEALNLVPGEQYIVYGVDYFDDYLYLVQHMRTTGFKHVPFAPFDPKLLREPTEKEIQRYKQNKNINVYMIYNNAPLEKWQYELFNSISMTLCSPINLLPYEVVLDENGKVIDWIPQSEYSYIDANGETVTITAEEFNRLYEIPTIARLDSSAQDFLASAEGEKWQAALEQSQANNHGFAVVGTQDVHQLPTFSLGDTKIGEGREFTAEEIANGAKVCIIHEWIAEKSGLKIGDTITLNFYGTDYGVPYQTTLADDNGYLRPSASMYFGTTPVLESAEYTIVGFWQGPLWPSAASEYYSFSSNTVFVPSTSVQTEMEQRNSLAFVSVILENGTIEQFHDLVKRAGYAGRFKYDDQGYSDIATNFHNYEALAEQIVLIGVALYSILLLLFLLLYPTTQRKTVRTMESLGCKFGRRFGHVLLSSMTILVLASALGGYWGTMLWDRVVIALQETTESAVALQLEPNVLKQVAASQLVLSLTLSSFIAVFVAIPRGISARR